MAIVSLIALLAALGLAALIGLQPWATSSVEPRLNVDPDLGIALGGARPVAPGPQRLAIGPSRRVSGVGSFAAGGAAAGEGVSRQPPSVAPAQAVARARPASPQEGPPEQPHEPSSPPQPSPAPQAVPVAVPASPVPPEPAAPPPTRAPGDSGLLPGPVKGGTGPIGGDPAGAVLRVGEGDEGALSLSFYIQPVVYREPGEENLILRFRSEAAEAPSFGLQLWDDGSGGQRGLWASGDAMGGERFLAPLAEGVWHEVAIGFRASSEDDGFYLLLLDGEPIDARAWVSLIDPGGSDAQLDVGLFRDGERIAGTPDVLFGPVQLGVSLEPVLP